MKEEIEKLNRLAKSLKDHGLAANLTDAADMAKSILSRSGSVKMPDDLGNKQTPQQEESTEKLENPSEPQTKSEADASEESATSSQTKLEVKTSKESATSSRTKQETIQPEENNEQPGYDITKETKTIQELMAEDAEEIYKEMESDEAEKEDEEEQEDNQTENKGFGLKRFVSIEEERKEKID